MSEMGLHLYSQLANKMNTTEIRKKVAAYMEVGFTMSEAFANIKDSSRIRAKRSGHKMAEICGNNENRTYNHFTKSFQYN